MSNGKCGSVREIFDAVADLPVNEQRARLDLLCGEDPMLRSRVEDLLEANNSAKNDSLVDYLQKIVSNEPTPSLVGQTIGHFHIIELIGEGGMGQVYLAQDLRLSRQVALKFLPAKLSHRADLINLFSSEARIASSLKHPNIVTIHDIGNSAGYNFIVMEFIKGRTLREHLLERVKFEMEEVCQLSVQVLNAIQCAHVVGIVHCDIKPENVILEEWDQSTQKSKIKVLDFGLARFGQAVSLEGSPLRRGTPEYLPPELYDGSQVDARSDIYSFGVMLHEMVYGVRPGNAVAESKSTLRGIDRIIKLCTAVDPAQRFQSVSEVLTAFQQLMSSPPRRISPVLLFKQQGAQAVTVLSFLFVLSISTISLVNRQSVTLGTASVIEGITPNSWADLTPNGRGVVFDQEVDGKSSVWIFDRETKNQRLLIEPRDARYNWPSISSDGRHLYLVRTFDGVANTPNVLIRVPLAGGGVEKIAEDVGSPIGLSPDGKMFAHVSEELENGSSNLWIQSLDGELKRVLVSRRAPSAYTLDGPVWSPDGKTIATTFCNQGNGIYYDVLGVDVENGLERSLTGQRWGHVLGVSWLEDGSGLIFHGKKRGGDLLHQLYQVHPLAGSSHTIVNENVDYLGRPAISPTTGDILAVYGNIDTSFWVSSPFSLDNFQPIETGYNMDGYEGADWVGNGRFVHTSRLNGHDKIKITDLAATSQLITTPKGNDRYPSASTDGQYIVFASDRWGQSQIFRADADGKNQIELTKGFNDMDPQIFPDGKWVLYTSVNSNMRTIWRVPIDGGTPFKLTADWAESPVISPDGRRVAYIANKSNFPQQAIAIMSIDGLEPTVYLNIQSPDYPRYRYFRWSPDGTAIDYIVVKNKVGNIWRHPLDGSAPRPLTKFFDLSILSFRWSADGSRLLVTRLDNTLKLHIIHCEDCPTRATLAANLFIDPRYLPLTRRAFYSWSSLPFKS